MSLMILVYVENLRMSDKKKQRNHCRGSQKLIILLIMTWKILLKNVAMRRWKRQIVSQINLKKFYNPIQINKYSHQNLNKIKIKAKSNLQIQISSIINSKIKNGKLLIPKNNLSAKLKLSLPQLIIQKSNKSFLKSDKPF